MFSIQTIHTIFNYNYTRQKDLVPWHPHCFDSPAHRQGFRITTFHRGNVWVGPYNPVYVQLSWIVASCNHHLPWSFHHGNLRVPPQGHPPPQEIAGPNMVNSPLIRDPGYFLGETSRGIGSRVPWGSHGAPQNCKAPRYTPPLTMGRDAAFMEGWRWQQMW